MTIGEAEDKVCASRRNSDHRHLVLSFSVHDTVTSGAMRSSNFIPPEIWITIAQNLSSRQVNQLASLCHTFAALANEMNKERMRVLHLSARFPANTSTVNSWNTALRCSTYSIQGSEFARWSDTYHALNQNLQRPGALATSREAHFLLIYRR